MRKSIVSDLRFDVSSQLRFPSVAVCQQFLLVVEQLFMGDGGILIVRAFDNGINRASLLAKSTINAFCHVDIVSGSSSRTIGSGFTLDSDGIGGASSCAQFASNASV